MPLSNLSGEQPSFERVIVPDDSYEGFIKEISPPFEGKSFDPTKGTVKKRRMDIKFKVDGEEKVIPYFVTNKITKEFEKGSASKLYTLLEKLGLIVEYIDNEEHLSNDDTFTVWFNEKTKNRKVKFSTRTSNKDELEKKYSVIDKIIKTVE